MKDIFDAKRIASIGSIVASVDPSFDTATYLAHARNGLAELSVMQRMRRISESLNAGLAKPFPQALRVLEKVVPQIDRGFVTLVFPDYVALYGQAHFDDAMKALRFFTPFGSSEFGVRYFLRADLPRALRVMGTWARDPDEHVRRLASEGSRPRLPWSFQLTDLMRDPSPTAGILEALKADTSPYVRKSVANHLNDIGKDHPDWMLERIESWSLDDKSTAWIARHALRSLIKKGNKRALTVIGAGAKVRVEVTNARVTPKKIELGERITLSFDIRSLAKTGQRIVVDYAIHFVKKSGGVSAKVFKLKTFDLAPGAEVTLQRSQSIENFTTRVHYAGMHKVVVLVNGEICATTGFDLKLSH